jgi:hypothetical protein
MFVERKDSRISFFPSPPAQDSKVQGKVEKTEITDYGGVAGHLNP